MKWFRVDNDLVNNPKVQRLPPSQFKALVNIWCLASKNDGVLPSMEEVAYALRIRPAKAQLLCSKFVKLRFIDCSTDGKLTPHNWNKRQFLSDDSTTRTKAYRKRERSGNGDVTPPDTDTDTQSDSDTDQNRSETQKGGAAPRPPSDEPRVAFDFYNRAAEELGLPKAISLTESRRKKFRARLAEHGIAGWFNAVNNIRRQPFLQGKNNNGWTMDLDFLLQAKSFPRVLEGFYIDKKFSRFADEFEELVEEAKKKDAINEQRNNIVYLDPPQGGKDRVEPIDECSSGERGNGHEICAEPVGFDDS